VERVLFICVHNSARSQMAEAYLKRFGGDRFEVESAGLEPGTINPLVVEVMKEEGIDLTGKETNSVFEFFKEGRLYSYVITVCSKEAEERCPVFPGVNRRLHWPFEDPSRFQGSREERLEKTRAVRDQIKARILEFIVGAEESPGPRAD
jgi:arsenate reductase